VAPDLVQFEVDLTGDNVGFRPEHVEAVVRSLYDIPMRLTSASALGVLGAAAYFGANEAQRRVGAFIARSLTPTTVRAEARAHKRESLAHSASQRRFPRVRRSATGCACSTRTSSATSGAKGATRASRFCSATSTPWPTQGPPASTP
jgi:hypothetical protein